ncbi:MAG: tetratricopeptide repeat protein [Burkholderiaceae bacterium]
MTPFVLLSLLLAAATLALLLARRPVPADAPAAAAADVAAARPSRALAAGLAALVLVVAGGGYAIVGSPRLLPLTPDAAPGPGPAADAVVATLQARADAHPADADAWFQAARAQSEQGRAAEAAQDLRRALALRPNDANLMADLADLVASLQGRLDGEPMQLVGRALAVDPNQVKALALQGQYAMTQKDFRTMLDSWTHAIRVAPPGDPIAAFLRQRLQSLRDAAAAAQAAPAASAAR